MAKKNMFESFAEKRTQEQADIEETVTTGKRKRTATKRGPNATTITLSISQEDKDLVREIAAKRGYSISDLLHQWIQNASDEVHVSNL